MADDYVCGECGQVSEHDYCPICESKMMKLGDFDDGTYDMDEENEDEEVVMDADEYEFDDMGDESLANAA